MSFAECFILISFMVESGAVIVLVFLAAKKVHFQTEILLFSK